MIKDDIIKMLFNILLSPFIINYSIIVCLQKNTVKNIRLTIIVITNQSKISRYFAFRLRDFGKRDQSSWDGPYPGLYQGRLITRMRQLRAKTRRVLWSAYGPLFRSPVGYCSDSRIWSFKLVIFMKIKLLLIILFECSVGYG